MHEYVIDLIIVNVYAVMHKHEDQGAQSGFCFQLAYP